MTTEIWNNVIWTVKTSKKYYIFAEMAPFEKWRVNCERHLLKGVVFIIHMSPLRRWHVYIYNQINFLLKKKNKKTLFLLLLLIFKKRIVNVEGGEWPKGPCLALRMARKPPLRLGVAFAPPQFALRWPFGPTPASRVTHEPPQRWPKVDSDMRFYGNTYLTHFFYK